MTSLSENENQQEIDRRSPTDDERSANRTDQSPTRTTVIQEVTSDESIDVHEKQEERTISDEQEQSDNATDEVEEKNATNAHHASPSIVSPAEGESLQQDATETIVNNDGEENRAKKYSNLKMKYPAIPSQQRAVYYNNSDPMYGAMPYYYYPPADSLEKPTPLMFISTEPPAGVATQISSSSSSSSSRDNPPGNSTSVSPQNLPPRLRQASSVENESTAPAVPSQVAAPSAPVNSRRHRSILPRAYANFYSQHPPPPLMATPPGVLYSYPPMVHPAGPIAYNIRSADELEYLAYQQQCLGLPPPVLWSPASQASLSTNGLPAFAPYPMAGIPASYVFHNPALVQTSSSALNPEASEWVPSFSDPEADAAENQILLDDEINFPPLNSAATSNPPAGTVTVKDHPEDNAEPSDSPVEIHPLKDHADDSSPVDATPVLSVSKSKVEATVTAISSQEDTSPSKAPLPAPASKATPITYSTVILQASDTSKPNKSTNPTQQSQRRQQATSPQINQGAARDRPIKASPPQQRSSVPTQNTNTRRRPPVKNNGAPSRTVVPSEANSLAKQQQQSSPVTDEWIEVKSKKTKKFDRITNDVALEKSLADEPVHPSVSPISSLSSTGENTTTPLTSEDDFDEKDQRPVPVIMDTDVPIDYNQTIIDDVRRRLNQKEQLLIIMRGCPGSGKSTLAKSLNYGYKGVILSTDDYFTDHQTNQYTFDINNLDEAHRYNRRRASDALKRNISPIIIDNTNTQAWEMKPYVAMGKEAAYDVLLLEPQTPWRYKARELAKRNRHDLPLKRIKDMVNRFEHDVTVQSLIEQLPVSNSKSNHCPSPSEVPASLPTTNGTVDPVATSKKFYDTIDDSLIVDDVRLCINDMILFLTSQFYQTALSSYTSILTNTTTTTTTTSQSSTPLSMSFHDLSLLSPTTSSLPSTPSTPHSRFHRPLTRFSSTATQDHSFNTEHLLRLPNTLTRCIDSLNPNQFTPTLSTQSSLIGKKRRRNKNKQSQEPPSPTELLLNTNNNNNNMEEAEETTSTAPQATFNVFLAEDCPDFVVIDEQNENDWINTVNRAFGIQINPGRDHSSTLSQKSKALPETKNCPLLDILHHELNQPSTSNKPDASLLRRDVAIQCSSEDFNDRTDLSYPVLIGHLSTACTVSAMIRPRPGYSECGIQVDLGDARIDSLEHLIELYAGLLSSSTVRQFYDDCQSNIQWTQIQLDEYLQHRNDIVIVPTLQQLSLNSLNRWNEQIKSSNPSCTVISLDDLLQDINDEEMNEEFAFDQQSTDSSQIEVSDATQMYLPWPIVHSLQELYGELPNTCFFESDHRGIALPIDDDLSISLYQALQRCVMEPPTKDSVTKPVIDNQMKTENKKKLSNNNQRWVIPSETQSTGDLSSNSVPSLKQIIQEEQRAAKSQKTKPKRQLDYATEHKLKELEQQFPTFDSDLLFDMFRENGYNYEITLACVSSILDEDAPIKKSQPVLPSRPISTTKTVVKPVLDNYDALRDDALRHGQRRKEFYAKAHHANGHGMLGVAAFYIHRASEEAQLMKDANRVACERLSRWRLAQFHQSHKLDLHGLHVDEALQLFKQVEQELNDVARRTTAKSIEIITGYGKNSVYGGGHGRIRSAILNYIQQRNYKYSEPNKGVILLQLLNTRN